MVAIKNVLFFAISASSLIIARDYPQINSDLQTLNADTVTLTNSVNNWDGTINGAIPIQNNFNTVDNDVKNGTKNANDSKVLISSNAQKLIDYINNTLEPNVKSSIPATKNKKPQFTAQGLQGTVLSNLKTLKNDSDTYSSALLAKTPSDKTSAAQAASAKLAADLQDGINYYS